jgi:small GTP-binding protein domain
MPACHKAHPQPNIPSGARKIVLAGNPNAGKSVFFNYLTGMYVDVSNYPGTTLEIYSGRLGSDVVTDTPGVYGISSFNEEERLARDIILSADLVLNVVSAAHLERDLFLTQQIIDTGVPVIVALNMLDEAKRAGLEVDGERLSELLGVPVIPTVAVKKEGLDRVKAELFTARPGNATPGLEEELAPLLPRVDTRGEAPAGVRRGPGCRRPPRVCAGHPAGRNLPPPAGAGKRNLPAGGAGNLPGSRFRNTPRTLDAEAGHGIPHAARGPLGECIR